MKPTADNRSCRSQARWIGVCPAGDQVRRRTGCNMKPLSSKKTIGLPLATAPFLSAASPACANASWRHRPPRVPVVRASGTSSPNRGASCRYSPDGTRREIAVRRPRQFAGRSKNRFDSRPSVVRPGELRQAGVSGWGSDAAFARDVVWLSRRPSLLSPQPCAIGSPNSPKRQGFRESRRCPCLGESSLLQAIDEFPTRLRFLSASYLNIRIFAICCSLTT